MNIHLLENDSYGDIVIISLFTNKYQNISSKRYIPDKFKHSV